MPKIQITEKILKKIIVESTVQLLTEFYHTLKKIAKNFADDIFNEIMRNKNNIETYLQNNPQGAYRTHKTLDLSSVYHNCEPIELDIYVMRVKFRASFDKINKNITISSDIFNPSNTQKYRSSILHEINHYVYTHFEHFNYVSSPGKQGDTFKLIDDIEYAFNKCELTARDTQLSYYLSELNGKPIDMDIVYSITNIDLMEDYLSYVKNDKYENNPSIVLGLNAIRNKTKKRNPSHLSSNDYNSYKNKIQKATYDWLKNKLYKNMLKTYDEFVRHVNRKIDMYRNSENFF